jgi:hypothetical protein
VISVQAIVLSLESLQIRRNHNSLKSLSFFFSPALRESAAATSSRNLAYVLPKVGKPFANISMAAFAPILLQKSFCTGDQKFCGL